MGIDKEQGVVAEDAVLSSAEIDAIGEILNISMGSAATAVSTMLDKQVIITTPKVEVQRFHDVSYAALEPAILVKIEYVEGISGSNVMVFRQSDMQVILNLLMGNEDAPAEDFVFDELSMSAACEVMNQMMGASATALSEFLGKTINISTPAATVMSQDNTFEEAMNLGSQDNIISVAFNLDIKDVMNSDFISVMTLDLAKMIVSQVMGVEAEAASKAAAKAAPAPAPAAPQAPAVPQAQPPIQQPAPAMAPPAAPPAAPGQPAAYPQQPMQNPYMPPEWQQQYGVPSPAYPPYGYPPYGYPPQQQMYQQPPADQGGQHSGVIKQPQQVQVQAAQFPNFGSQANHMFAAPLTSANMDLVMNVPLSVTVEIGKTKRKIREIVDFSQGTVIELEKQAGAPVDIVVNGQLIARGDVVVIDDNFGVRITEIVGTKELIDSLESN